MPRIAPGARSGPQSGACWPPSQARPCAPSAQFSRRSLLGAPLGVLVLAMVPAVHADLKKALAEPDLEKRSKLALDNALAAYQTAREAYEKGEIDRVQSSIDEMEQSVNLAYQSLEDTGKNPRKSPRWFKNAELATRDLSRRIASFQEGMSYADRPLLDKAKARVQMVHDDLLLGLMEGRKK